MLLALAGAMGQVADDAARQSRSLAVRTALGAAPDFLVWETLRRTARTAAIGLGAGGALGFVVVRLLANRVPWVESGDPFLVLGPVALLALLVLAAGAAVGFRAARNDPWEALRSL